MLIGKLRCPPKNPETCLRVKEDTPGPVLRFPLFSEWSKWNWPDAFGILVCVQPKVSGRFKIGKFNVHCHSAIGLQ